MRLVSFPLFLGSLLLASGPGDVPKDCAKLTEQIFRGRQTLYKVILSSNVEALRNTKINTVFPSPNMSPQTPETWLAPDAEYAEQMEVRRNLYKKHPKKIFQVMRGHEAQVRLAGQELLEQTAEHLAKQFPEYFRLDGRNLTSLKDNRVFDLDDKNTHPLVQVGLLVQDDVTINARRPDGKVYLIGGFVATPTLWSMGDFLGADMDTIHVNVHGYKERLQKTVDGALAKAVPHAVPPEHIRKLLAEGKLQGGPPPHVMEKLMGGPSQSAPGEGNEKGLNPIRRNNWFIYQNGEIAQPSYHRSTYPYQAITRENLGQTLYLRSELESVVQLPKSGTVLFSIRPRVWTMDYVKQNAPELLPNIAEGLFTHSREEYYNEPWAPDLYRFLTGDEFPADRARELRRRSNPLRRHPLHPAPDGKEPATQDQKLDSD